ncbi:MAG TPA: Pr6Pr family membrane protein [Pseudonocardiaceae bacterium]|nr:Pr6Pr family membrane protein [Pseudonocardiaceae bacterium]
MRLNTVLVGGYRVAFAALAAVAIGWQAHQVTVAGNGLGNFFSFFTIESNILGVIVFGWGGLALLAGRRGVPDVVRGAAVVYLAITGVVYALLLAGIEGQDTASWVNTVVHQVMPIVAVLDWLLAPPRTALPLPRVWWWLVFPLLYLAYTLIRGPFAHWYPYPFLDPRPHGYGHVVVGAVGIAVGFVVATLLVRWAGEALRRRSVAQVA